MVPNQPQPALLFMPDISGFTQFVNDVEILHSQQIVQELLETLIECNELGLQVGEIEGDAIFFYKLGEKPDMPSLLHQVEKMFTRFHQHLKLYDHQRFCPCKACETAIKLKLKIVSHYGEVTGISVKDHKKLFGKDVILIHRLLKNNLDKKEYVLLTDPVVASPSGTELPQWYEPRPAVENYDVGEVQFYFSDLSGLYDRMGPLEISRADAAAQTFTSFTVSKRIPAPMLQAFSAIADLPKRAHWMEGVKRIELMTNEHLHRVGTKHRCIIGEKNNPVMVTESVKMEPGRIEFVEMDEKGMAGCRFTFTQVSNEETDVSVDMLIKNNIMMKLMFNMIMRSKYLKSMKQSLQNLQNYLQAVPVEPSVA
jgi:hypothetical protein